MERNASSREILLDRAKESSTQPGVYLMKDPGGVILYVGKAKNLRNRITSYFQPALNPSLKTERMVAQVHHFDTILTETESEALILECTLIKKHKPKYNIRLKDDKAYPYIRIQVDAEMAPRVEYVRRIHRDGSRYFGPFTSGWAARQVVRLLTEAFKLRDCSDNTFRHRSRACILHQMGKCSAPCVGLISPRDYRQSVIEAVAVMEGKSDRVVKSLEVGMLDAAEREEYELAAEYRDQLASLQSVTETQAMHVAGSERDRDIVGLARKEGHAHGTLLQVRGGRLVSVKHYHLQNTDSETPNARVLKDFLAQHYLGAQDQEDVGSIIPPKDVLLPFEPEDRTLLEHTLRLPMVVLASADSTQAAEQRILNVAATNAEHALEQSVRREGGHGLKALEEVQKHLQLAQLPVRIECYDISNIHGQDAVASRVVFVDGAPDKSLYRRYKIKTVEGSNDFAMMKEVLGRRFGRADEELPQLVVVDGGKGQLSQAVAILDELGVPGVEVCGLAKARTERDFQSTEVRASQERIFIPGRKNPVLLYPTSEAFKLLTHVRDEAHRFAVSYHRVLRSKRSLNSKE